MRYMSAGEAGRLPPSLGVSDSMRQIDLLIKKIAPSSLNVLISGESGTGKEVVARALHNHSLRWKGPFVAVNCAALPEQLVESELFGHERGAFTGAMLQRVGKFELAQRGTILLDEVGDMPLLAQAKTLRVLQERELHRIGGNKSIKLDIRIVSATNKELEGAVRNGSFREDLLYRLKSYVIRVPPLRERKEDIPYLAHHFLKKYARENGRAVTKISPEAMEALMDYAFPGNVRELESAIQVAAVLADSDHISAEDLPDNIGGAAGAKRRESLDDGKSVELMAALRSVTITDREGVEKRWHATLRSVTMEEIHQFLLRTGGDEFSRQEFASFLSMHGKNSRNRYGTAGRYLRILRHHGILAHNGKKANETRFRLHSP